MEGIINKSLVCTKANLSLDRDQDMEYMHGMMKKINFIMIKILINARVSMMVNGNLINLMEQEYYRFLVIKK